MITPMNQHPNPPTHRPGYAIDDLPIDPVIGDSRNILGHVERSLSGA